MPNPLSLHKLLWIPTAAMVLACEPEVAKPPVMTLTFSSSSSYLQKVLADNHTVAFGVDELAPISEDPLDTEQFIFFTHASKTKTPVRQEVLVFDVDWAQPLLNPIPTEDYRYIPGVNFVSVVASEFESTSNFDSQAVTSHAVRYWHGDCSIRESWDTLFDTLSDSVLEGLLAESTHPLVTSVTRVFDVMQPNFIGLHSLIKHGFTMEARYEIDTALFGDVEIEANPAYTFGVTGNGYVSVASPHQGVVVLNGPASIKAKLRAAFKHEVPNKIAERINAALTFRLDLPGLDCNPGQALTQQQETCHQIVTNAGGTVVEEALLKAGYPASAAKAKASSALAGMRAANFTCDSTPEKQPTCAFHPVVQRVNVLPDELEFVLAGEPEYSPAIEKDRVTLYEILPDLIEQLNGDDSLDPLCHTKIGRDNGVIDDWPHGAATIQ